MLLHPRQLLLLFRIVPLLVVACSGSYAVWLDEGATLSQLDIRLATNRGGTSLKPVRFFVVDSINCDLSYVRPGTGRMWALSADGADKYAHRLALVRYGSLPAGFVEDTRARPLIAGCYSVIVAAEEGRVGGMILRVHPDSTLEEVDPNARSGA